MDLNPKNIKIGDRVRYTGEYLRSVCGSYRKEHQHIVLNCDLGSARGKVLDLLGLSTHTKIATVDWQDGTGPTSVCIIHLEKCTYL